MLNSDNLCELLVQTPGKRVRYDGDARIDGVPGSAAPIVCNYFDVAGSATGSLLPTGRALDVVDGVEVTCIDNGMPVVVLRAKDLGITGYETPKELDANTGAQGEARVDPVGGRAEDEPRRRDEEGRAEDEPDRARARGRPRLHAHVHPARLPRGDRRARRRVGRDGVHPAGLGDARNRDGAGGRDQADVGRASDRRVLRRRSRSAARASSPRVLKAGLLRTARLIFRGELLVPAAVWDGGALTRGAR